MDRESNLTKKDYRLCWPEGPNIKDSQGSDITRVGQIGPGGGGGEKQLLPAAIHL